MSFKEVKELRQSGKLDEALKMAEQDLEKSLDDIWYKRSIAWVYYAFLKKNATQDKFKDFLEILDKLNNLALPEDEKMVFDKSAFQIGKVLFELGEKPQNIEYRKVNQLFETIKNFHFTKPSEAYSFLYKAFHKCYKNWDNYIAFADWWGFENFREENFLPQEFKGKKIMATVEQAYIAYSLSRLSTSDLL